MLATAFPRPACRLIAAGCALAIALAAGAKPVRPPGPQGFGISPLPAEQQHASEDVAQGPESSAQFVTSPSPLPANLPSVRFESAGISEFGDHIRLDGPGHFIGSVSVAMSSGALRSESPGATAFGYTHPVTLSLYTVDRSGAVPRSGELIARLTDSFLIPWRPEPDASTSALPGRPWRAADGALYTARAFTLTFDVGALGLALPDEIVFGVSFNTQRYGPQPLRVPGPYDALAVAMTEHPAGIGRDVHSDALFVRATQAAGYTDGGTAGINEFRSDAGWTPFRPAIRVTNSNFGAIFDHLTRLDALRPSVRELRAALVAARSSLALALDRDFWDGNQRLDPYDGSAVFDLLADASEDLALLASSEDPHAFAAQEALRGLIRSSVTLAETAIADAIILGGGPRRILQAQSAVDLGADHEVLEEFGRAIDAYGVAWREAQGALR